MVVCVCRKLSACMTETFARRVVVGKVDKAILDPTRLAIPR
jgi:hypothetical protein